MVQGGVPESEQGSASTQRRGAWLRRGWQAVRDHVFARHDAATNTWSRGWLRWPTGAGGVVVTLLLIVKLAVTTWNCAVFDGSSYDEGGLHVPRARDGGIGTAGRSYNPPLYYMATLPAATRYAQLDAEKAEKEAAAGTKKKRLTRKQKQQAEKRQKKRDDYLLGVLRWSNLGYLVIFYVAWIGAILPRLIADRRRAWLAMLVLLAIPGYQKLAAMVHPDNALSGITALGIAVWLVLRDDARPVGRRVYLLAICAGLVALTRPFGVLPCGALLVACGFLIARDHKVRSATFVNRMAISALLTTMLAASWPGYQLATLGRLSEVYEDHYLAPYLPHRPGFDRVGYFLSFHPVDLLEVPNRNLRELDTVNDKFHNKYGNSFWTLLYSETWGEHWLYFSGKYKTENKLWAKRVMLAVALPTIPLLLFAFFRGVAASVGRIRRWRSEAEPDTALFMLSFFVLAVAMYLYWHLTDGITPGKNSSVKFIYNAYIYPVGLALCFVAPLRKLEDRVWPPYAIVLFVASLPVVFYVPAWLLPKLGM